VGEARFDEADGLRLVHAFLRRSIEEAAPLTDVIDGERHALFEGRADALRFVGHLPAHRGGGGLHFLDLHMRNGAEGAELVLRHRPAWPEATFDSHGDDWQQHTLIPSVGRVRFRYFGETEDGAVPQWRESWSGVDRLPALVEIRIDDVGSLGWAPIRAAVRVRAATLQAALLRASDGAIP
jgi:hypothetical protein